MADDLDPTPTGYATASGTLSPQDPLIDWASNLHKDDLANLLQDPYRHAQALAARGVPPPSPEAMDQMHNVNDQHFGTPTKSDREVPASPPDNPLYGPYRFDATTGKLKGNLTDSDSAAAAVAPPKGPLPYATAFASPERGGATPGPGGGSVSEKIKEGWRKATTEQEPKPYGRPGSDVPREENRPGRRLFVPNQKQPSAPAPSNVPWAKPVTEMYPNPPTPQERPKPEPAATTEPKSQGDEEPAGDSLNPKTPEGRRNLGNTISALGKAMQGVKAPEPLRPPNIGAPSVRGPNTISAPQIAQLLGMASGVSQGQVPASVMPILHLLGRV